MTDYTELVRALRSASTVSTAWEKLMLDAAAAIEALETEIRESMQKCAECGENEPKRGEIVRCKECRWGPICMIGQNLGLDGFCSKGEREVQE